MRTLRLGNAGRYYVPVDEPEIVHYFLNRLSVAHGRRRRWLHALLAPAPPSWRRLQLGRATTLLTTDDRGLPTDSAHGLARSGGSESFHTALGLVGETLSEDGEWSGARPQTASTPASWILMVDDSQTRFPRVVLFLFSAGCRRPEIVIKIRCHEGSATTLAGEHSALAEMRRRLPPDLASRAPSTIGYRRTDRLEALAVEALDGTSLYVQLARSATPERLAGRHLSLAAAWLSAFHSASPTDKRLDVDDLAREVSAADAALGTCAAPLIEELRPLTQAGRIRHVASHGDFWHRNVLDDGDRGVVLDWEHSLPAASPAEDLFRFPLAWISTIRGAGDPRADAARAFVSSFLEDNQVADAVRDYFRTYCEGTGLPRRALKPLLSCYLVTRGPALWQRAVDGGRGGSMVARSLRALQEAPAEVLWR